MAGKFRGFSSALLLLIAFIFTFAMVSRTPEIRMKIGGFLQQFSEVLKQKAPSGDITRLLTNPALFHLEAFCRIYRVYEDFPEDLTEICNDIVIPKVENKTESSGVVRLKFIDRNLTVYKNGNSTFIAVVNITFKGNWTEAEREEVVKSLPRFLQTWIKYNFLDASRPVEELLSSERETKSLFGFLQESSGKLVFCTVDYKLENNRREIKEVLECVGSDASPPRFIKPIVSWKIDPQTAELIEPPAFFISGPEQDREVELIQRIGLVLLSGRTSTLDRVVINRIFPDGYEEFTSASGLTWYCGIPPTNNTVTCIRFSGKGQISFAQTYPDAFSAILSGLKELEELDSPLTSQIFYFDYFTFSPGKPEELLDFYYYLPGSILSFNSTKISEEQYLGVVYNVSCEELLGAIGKVMQVTDLEANGNLEKKELGISLPDLEIDFSMVSYFEHVTTDSGQEECIWYIKKKGAEGRSFLGGNKIL